MLQVMNILYGGSIRNRKIQLFSGDGAETASSEDPCRRTFVIHGVTLEPTPGLRNRFSLDKSGPPPNFMIDIIILPEKGIFKSILYLEGKIMKILVSGGAGFIGSNVVDGYIREGHAVVVVDNLYTGKKANINPKAKFYPLDIRSKEIEGVMEKERPTVLNHHAAQISVPVSVADPVLDAEINLTGLLNLLEKGIKYGVKKVVFISSGGAIYGEASQYPTSEAYAPIPLSPYAVSKFSSEHYLKYYHHQYGLDYTILRYANIYGPRQIPHGEAGVVSIFMDNLLKGKPSTLNHFKEDPEGMIRDYCYVGDVVKANIKALTHGNGEIFNIGTGSGTKTSALYQTVYEVFKEAGSTLPDGLSTLDRQPARPGDIRRSCLVVDKAREKLGWIPETDLKEGIRLTLKWRIAATS